MRVYYIRHGESGANILVVAHGAGSGVIQDLCKYVSKETGIPYMIVATAPSMDGYASDGAAMILGGMKVTVKAGLPGRLPEASTICPTSLRSPASKKSPLFRPRNRRGVFHGRYAEAQRGTSYASRLAGQTGV